MDNRIRNKYRPPPTKISSSRPFINFKPKADPNQHQSIPYKAILLAIFLFVIGTLLLVLSFRIYQGHFTREFDDKFIPAIVLGLLCFIPGSYYMCILLHIYAGYREFSYSDIHSSID